MIRGAFAFSTVSLLAAQALAQCFTFGGQQPSLTLIPGAEVYDLEVIDRDGPGPQQPVLMIGGFLAGSSHHAWQWNGTTATPITNAAPVRQFAGSATGTWYTLREDNVVEVRSPTLPMTTLGGFTGHINTITDVNGTLWGGGQTISSAGATNAVLARVVAGRWQDATPFGMSTNSSIYTIASWYGNGWLLMGGAFRRTMAVGVPAINAAFNYPWTEGAFSANALFNSNGITHIATGAIGGSQWLTDGTYLYGGSLGSVGGPIPATPELTTITALEVCDLGDFFGTVAGQLYRIRSVFNQNSPIVGTGILANGPIYAIELFQNDLYIAGAFTEVNGQPAIGIARLLNTGAPQFTQQPSNQQVFATETLTLAAPVANPTDVTFQWSLNGAPIGNGLALGGQLTSGANTAVLTIQRPRVTMSGLYTLRATNACGSSTTTPIEVTVVPACDSIDFNNDGIFPDDADIAAFFRIFAGGQCFE